MQLYVHHRFIFIGIVVLLCVLIFLALEYIYIINNGKPVLAPEVRRQAATIGSGERLTYVILGDSTAVSQGGEYDQGIAVTTAGFLGNNYTVMYYNFGQVGARTADVLSQQLNQAVELAPDVVLLAVGANDVTHLTRLDSIDQSLTEIISRLKTSKPSVKIVLTGSPEMGSVPRFPWPIREFARLRTRHVNEIFQGHTGPEIIMAPIATETGPLFDKDPSLFAQDNFHPTTEGYKIWVPVVIKALTAILQRQ